MEELFFDGELEEVEKKTTTFDFPVIYVGDINVCFNWHSRPLLGEAIRWYSTPELIIGLPCKRGMHNAYHVAKQDIHRALTARFPNRLKNEKKLQKGYYKLYKYKDGFAFKRYEQLGAAHDD